MKRLLIVSPHFPPVNAADMHRVRVLLPYLRENGWEAEVLAVSPDAVAGSRDPWLADGLPADVPVHRVKALGLGWSRVPALRGLGFRSLRALAGAGDRLLKSRPFDMIYFSTTVLETHLLGPRWHRRFGVPFVVDYQDPWVNDYYRQHPEIVPPGGRVKYFFADAIHRWIEPRVLRLCAGITSVSSDYPQALARRYPSRHLPPVLVQPFPGARGDFERLPKTSGRVTQDGTLRWVYIGRGGADMARALRGLFMTIRDHVPEALRRNLKLQFIGTSYVSNGAARPSVAPIAAEFGLTEMVEETPGRIPYSETLVRLREADALIVPGSDDPAYTASKIYPYLLAGRPLLAIFHRKSSVVDLIREVNGGICVTFDSAEDDEALAQRIAAGWIEGEQYTRSLPLNVPAFEPYTDRGSAATLARFLERCMESDGVRESSRMAGVP